jgi:hypothetical protein
VRTAKVLPKKFLIFLGIAALGLVLAGAIITASGIQTGILSYENNGSNSASNSCVTESVFDTFSHDSSLGNEVKLKTSGEYVSKNGTIAYLYDDFSTYAKSQQVIDNFDDLGAWSSSSSSSSLSPTDSIGREAGGTNLGTFQLVDEYYSGPKALSYVVPTNIPRVILSRTWDTPKNLDRWSQSGYITMWVKIENPNIIDSVNVSFEDQLGNKRTYIPLQNTPHISTQRGNNNTIVNDPAIPDLIYPKGNPKTEMWTDFMLARGWNYLLWRADIFSEDTGKSTNMASISKVSLDFEFNKKTSSGRTTTIILDDLRIQDGLQKSSNPTGGIWYPPHGRPQYGVYDIDSEKDADGEHYQLSLLNVRNTQYPSNGDHAIMISSAAVPKDFVMRVKFTLTQLGQADQSISIPSLFPEWTPKEFKDVPLVKGMRNNTLFSVGYDFEPDWDPSHEWFGPYLSLEYNKFGILTVWPLERNVLQDQEPKAGETIATTEFTPHNGVQYEMQVLVKGQFVSSTIYEVRKDNGNNDGYVSGNNSNSNAITECLVRKATTSYTFEHPRHGDDKRYPLGIESTGNVRTLVHQVEMVSLEKPPVWELERLHSNT